MAYRFLFALFVLFACDGLRAQDWDVHLLGNITDDATGNAIPFALLEVSDQFDNGFSATSRADATGRYHREFYAGGKRRGGLYLVEFAAEGYQSRMAMLDLSEVTKGKEEATAWRISMNVALKPLGKRTAGEAELLGVCVWHRPTHTLRWNDEVARKAYPIERYIEAGIKAHRSVVDSVYLMHGLMVDGVVKDHWTDKPLEGVDVHVSCTSDSIPHDTLYRTDRLGYYVMSLVHGAVYRLEYGRDDLVHKRIDMDLTTIPAQEEVGSFRSTIDIRLFSDLPGEDLSFLEAPMGLMRYDPNARNMAWDMAFSQPILERLSKILARHVTPAQKRR